MKRIVLATLAAAFLVAAGTAVAYAQWPATCVQLNDIVESRLGNHGAVGIYQRTFPNPFFAEDHCQNDHGDDVRAAFAWAIRAAPYTPSSGTLAGGWPETCVQLNDIVEAHSGNHGNVGIYQRAYGYGQTTAWSTSWTYRESPIQGFRWTLTGPASRSGVEPSNGGKLDVTFDDLPPGSYTFAVRVFNAAGDGRPAFANFIIDALPLPQAEANCRSDHLADVQATFAWAFERTSYKPPVGAPTPESSPSLAGNVPTAPRNLSVQPLDSVTRGGDVTLRAASPADGGGLPLQGYYWSVTGATTRVGAVASSGGGFDITLQGLAAGEHTFTVSAYNARGSGPSASISFTVVPPPHRDPTLQAALNLLLSLLASEWPEMADLVESPEVQATRIVFGPLPSDTWARYSPAEGAITVHDDLRGERLQALAATLAHEIWHVGARHGNWYPNTAEGCFQDEIAAARAGAVAWDLTRAGSPQTDFEWFHEFMLDARDDGTLESVVRGSPGYRGHCNGRAA